MKISAIGCLTLATLLGMGESAMAQTVYAISNTSGKVYEIPPGHSGAAPPPIGEIEQDDPAAWTVIKNTPSGNDSINIDLTYLNGAIYGLVSGYRGATSSSGDGHKSKIFRISTTGSFDNGYGNSAFTGFNMLQASPGASTIRVAEGLTNDGTNLIATHYDPANGGAYTAVSDFVSTVDEATGVISGSQSTRFATSLPDIDVPNTVFLRDVDGIGRCNANSMVVNTDQNAGASFINDIGSLPNLIYKQSRIFNDPNAKTQDIAFTGPRSFVVAGHLPQIGPGYQLHYFEISSLNGNVVHQRSVTFPAGERVIGVASDNEEHCEIEIINNPDPVVTNHGGVIHTGTLLDKTEVTCCPPSNDSALLIEQFDEVALGPKVTAPTKLKWSPSTSFNQQMQWTINLLNAQHPQVTKLVIALRLYDVTGGGDTLVDGPMYVIWEPDPTGTNTMGNPAAIGAGGNFFNAPLQNNRKYELRAITGLEDANGSMRFLDFAQDCKNSGFFYGDTANPTARQARGARGFSTLDGKAHKRKRAKRVLRRGR